MAFEGETLERAALAELHAVATPEIVESLGLATHSDGAGLVSVAAALPASAIVINRAIGVGVDAPATPDSLRAIIETYKAADVGRYFVQRHPKAEPAAMPDVLVELGLEKARGWQKFSRGPGDVPEAETDLRVERVGPEHGADFARIVCAGFDLGDAAEPWLARLPQCPNWSVFMCFEGEPPAGVGGLFINDGLAWTDFGATDPAFRRRGAQAAVLAARVRFAFAQGAREVMTCTGEDVPGDPQHSYNNILRIGFKETYVRENYAPPRT
jgi:hypothetical protein